MEYICEIGEKTEHFSPEKYSPYPGHILERQSMQHRSLVSCWPSQYVHSAQEAQNALAWSCPPHGRLPHSKRQTLKRAGIREENHWPSTTAIQGRLHETHEGIRHRCRILGGPCSDRTRWRSNVNQYLKTGKENLFNAAEHKRIRRKERSNSSRPETTHRSDLCGRVCLSRVGVFSHRRRCFSQADSQNSLDASPIVSDSRRTLLLLQ